jgi:hypothetical protein
MFRLISGRCARRRPRRTIPSAEAIERRLVLSVTGLTASASPAILRPINPNNQPHAVTLQHILRVTVAGQVSVDQGTPALSYQVVDQYGRFQPSGQVMSLVPAGPGEYFYTVQFGLSILRDPHIPGGRNYAVIIKAQDGSSVRFAVAGVTVPPVGFFTQRPARAGA